MLATKLKQPIFSIAVLALFTACGSNSSDSSGGSTAQVEPTIQSQKGELIGGNSEVSYSCGDTVEQLDENGSFECNSLPVSFEIEGELIGSITQLPSDAKVYPTDLVGVDRSEINNSKVQKIVALYKSAESGESLLANEPSESETITDTQAVKQAIEALVLDDQEPLTHSLELMSEGEYNTTIVWESSNEDILSSDGQLTPPSALDGEATLSLEALVSRGEVSERVVYNFRVPVEGGVR